MSTNALASLPALDTPPEAQNSRSPAKTKLGHIVSTSGSQSIAVLESSMQSLRQADRARVQIGELVTIMSPQSTIVGIVSGLSSPMTGTVDDCQIHLAELTLVGELLPSKQTGKPTFRRGVGGSLAIGDSVESVNRQELECVYLQSDAPVVEIGTLSQDSGVPANLLVDGLFGRHFLVVGSTGSGKSCVVKAIMHQLIEGHEHAHIVIFDLHNEYGETFGSRAECIRPKDLHLPFWLLNFVELCAVLTCDDRHHGAEVEILADAILAAKRRYAGEPTVTRLRRVQDATVRITVDTPSPFLLSSIVSYIDEQLGKLERTQAVLPYRRLKGRIESLVGDARYSFMFGALSVEDNMVDVLGRLFRLPSDGKPITVIDLAVVPSELLDVVISLVARLAMDIASWSETKIPLHLVCEEAHRYSPEAGDNKSAPARAVLARIAKEGRKYGVSLGLVTQRPSELASTVISQCSTIIAMRLSTERDQDVIRANANEGMLHMLDFLPVLGDREAIVLGQGASMPMRIHVHELRDERVAAEPHQGISSAWKNTNVQRQQVEAIVSRWRKNG